MRTSLIILCMSICLMDLAQLFWFPPQWGPVLGAVLYSLLAIGVHRGLRAAHIIVLLLPIVPIATIAMNALDVTNLSTPWTVHILALQLAASAVALTSLRTGNSEQGP